MKKIFVMLVMFFIVASADAKIQKRSLIELGPKATWVKSSHFTYCSLILFQLSDIFFSFSDSLSFSL